MTTEVLTTGNRFVNASTLSDADRSSWLAKPGAHEIRIRHGIGEYVTWIMVSGDVEVVEVKAKKKGKKTA